MIVWIVDSSSIGMSIASLVVFPTRSEGNDVDLVSKSICLESKKSEDNEIGTGPVVGEYGDRFLFFFARLIEFFHRR